MIQYKNHNFFIIIINKNFILGLRQRLCNLFLQFVETPEFNPEAARFQKIPYELLLANVNEKNWNNNIYKQKNYELNFLLYIKYIFYKYILKY